MRITTIFNDAGRPDTTGVYLRQAFIGLGHQVTHFNPAKDTFLELGSDLYVMVDDGYMYELQGEIPNLAFWAIDTHLTPEMCEAKARIASKTYCAQKDASEKYGWKWLPLACDPDIHSPQDYDYELGRKKKYDVCFVGTVTNSHIFDGRREFLEAVFKAYPNFFYGQRFFRDATDVYANSRIVLNYCVKEDLNMRVFEAAASGSLLLTNQCHGLSDIFNVGGQVDVCGDTEDAISIIGKYLKDPLVLDSLGRSARWNVLNYHTYRHRAATIIEDMKNGWNQ